MTSFAFLVAFIVISAGCGWPLVARLDTGKALTDAERFCVSFAVGSLFFYFTVFAVGLIRLDRTSMGAVDFLSFLLAIPGCRAMVRSGIHTTIALPLGEIRRDRRLAVLWLAVIGIGASSLLQSWAPPSDYDSLNYHLAIPQFDVEIGRITPPWFRQGAHTFFPAGMYHLYRLALVLTDFSAAQAIHGFYGIITAIATAALAGRLGASRHVSLLAALLFLAVRVVIWEMGTAAGDVAITGWFTLSLGVYLSWRQKPSTGLLVLLGILIGGGVLAKYHGAIVSLCMAALLLVDFARGRVGFLPALTVPSAALLVFSPHLVYMYTLTGSPLFPFLSSPFTPGVADFFINAESQYGTGRGIFDFLTAPATLSILPMHYFDGMMLGAPYFLALAPLALLARKTIRFSTPMLIVVLMYYAIWFYQPSRQVRFLMPILPFLSIYAAVGAQALWQRAQPSAWGRIGFVVLTTAMVLNQFLFVGAYVALRLPVAFGIQSPESYHATPTMKGAFYAPCMYIRNHLHPGERYLSLVRPHFIYCPQASAQLDLLPDEEKKWIYADWSFRPISRTEFIDIYETNRFRYVIVLETVENRRNKTGRIEREAVDLNAFRFGRFIAPAIRNLTPLARDEFAAVYDGRDVLAELKKLPDPRQ